MQAHFHQGLSQGPPQPINLSWKKPGGHIQRLSDSRMIPRVRPRHILVTASLICWVWCSTNGPTQYLVWITILAAMSPQPKALVTYIPLPVHLRVYECFPFNATLLILIFSSISQNFFLLLLSFSCSFSF